MPNHYKKAVAGSLAATLTVIQLLAAAPLHAAVSGWHQGANIVPVSTTDFGSGNFQQSLRNLQATGANYVSLVVPYYQSNIWSTDVAPGWNTPTDASLESAIDFAHSLGFSVALKMHVDPYSGDWRAYINPDDRDSWYRNYGNHLLHLAGIAQAHGVEMIVVGTELVSMAAYSQNGDNTARWQNLISQVRAVYSGKLTYNANSNNNTSGGPFEDEKDYIGFWGHLDYAGLSTYYGLSGDNSVSNLQNQWDYWNNADLKGFAARVGKPLLFLEAGYRSVDNAHTQPWNWAMGGNPNETEQSNSYEALLSYWNNYDYVAGVFFWHWETDPNAGGPGSTSYTPQNKAAEDVLTRWFTDGSTPTPPPSGAYSFTASGSVSPSAPTNGSPATLGTTVRNLGTALSGGIVDIEVYDQSSNRVFQKFNENVSIPAGGAQDFTASWTPGSTGTYAMSVGVFSGGWAQNYYWNGSAASISVSGSTTAPPPNPPLSTAGPVNIWWPTDGAQVSGLQPFKAMVEDSDVSQYRMFWAVGSGTWNEMFDNSTDYPHKEVLVDLSGWNWSGSGPYPITFTATEMNGSTVMTQKAINIGVQ